MAARLKPNVGDVFEVTLRDRQLAYVQMVSESPAGEVVRVLAGRFASASTDIAALVGEPHEYMMFAALRILVGDGYARRVGTWPVPQHGAWSGLRYVLVRGRSGQIEARVLSDGRSARERMEVLPPPSMRKSVPIWVIGPSLDVVDTLMASRDCGLEPDELEAWRHENGLRGPVGIAEAVGMGEEPGVRHFAVFADGVRLDKVMADLEDRGFTSTVFTDPDIGGQLLVIAAGPHEPGSINDHWDQVEEVVEAAGGEYDGWEAPAGESRS